MTDYRRDFIAGASFFFTVNLAERRLRLLTEHTDELRTALRQTRRHHPFAWSSLESIPRIGPAMSRMTARVSANGGRLRGQVMGFARA
jgi:hypothetical protein